MKPYSLLPILKKSLEHIHEYFVFSIINLKIFVNNMVHSRGEESLFMLKTTDRKT